MLLYHLGLPHVVALVFGRYDLLFLMLVVDFRRLLLFARLSLPPIHFSLVLFSLHRGLTFLFSSLFAIGLFRLCLLLLLC